MPLLLEGSCDCFKDRLLAQVCLLAYDRASFGWHSQVGLRSIFACSDTGDLRFATMILKALVASLQSMQVQLLHLRDPSEHEAED